MHQELRALLNEISTHNKPLSEAAESIYFAIYENMTTDLVNSVEQKVGENVLHSSKVNGAAKANGITRPSPNETDQDIDMIEREQTAADLADPDVFDLPSEAELPPDVLPQDDQVQPEQDQPLSPEQMEEPVISGELNDDALDGLELDFNGN